MQNPFVGQITVYPYNFAPNGWAACEGQLLPISQFTALFSLLGTAFGGNGTSNFALPDLRGRVPLGIGQLPGGNDYLMGEIDGVESVTLIATADMASHNHSLTATTVQGTVNNPSGAFLAAPFVGGGRGGGGSTGDPYNLGTPNTPLVAASLAISGGGLPHNNIQPSLVLMPCIALRGVFPARN
jgi:microcystin-dependent protein